MEAQELRFLGRVGDLYDNSRELGEAVGLHEAPGEVEPLHAQWVLGPVVEAGIVAGVDQGVGHCSGVREPGLDRGWPALGAAWLRHVPDFPPVFSNSSTRVIVTPFSTAFTMS